MKSGIRLHSIESVDKIWLTCCALHNMLLEVDGLDEPWDGVRQPTSQWEGELGNLESDDVPMAMRCLMSPADIRAYDTSSLGTEVTARREEERDEEEEEENETEQDDGDEELNEDAEEEVRIVRKLSLKYFRSKLVEHFDTSSGEGKLCGQVGEARHLLYILTISIVYIEENKVLSCMYISSFIVYILPKKCIKLKSCMTMNKNHRIKCFYR